jgi:Fe-S cluster assembly protein SufB
LRRARQLAKGQRRLPGDLVYFSAPKTQKDGRRAWTRSTRSCSKTYEKLGIPLHERAALAGVAVDAVFDSVSVATTFKKKLARPASSSVFSEAVREHPELVRKYLGAVVPITDNYYAALNSAVFSDGSFVYVPKGVRCPMELSTYFRINAKNRPVRAHADRRRGGRLRQLPRGLHGADARREPAPRRGGRARGAGRRRDQVLHGAELVPGRRGGQGRHLQLRHQARHLPRRALASAGPRWRRARRSPGSTRACILKGDDSVGEFYSVALTNNCQQADTGTKMIHIGRNTRSTIVSKGISAGRSHQHLPRPGAIIAEGGGAPATTRSATPADRRRCGAHTFPYIEVKNPTATVEHEATTSKISDDQLFYCAARAVGRRTP